MYKFIIEEKNVSKIKSFLETEEKFKLNYVSLSKILIFIRRCCAKYIKDYYRFNKLGRRSGGSLISVDKSDFVDVEGEKLWILGAKMFLNQEQKRIVRDLYITISNRIILLLLMDSHHIIF